LLLRVVDRLRLRGAQGGDADRDADVPSAAALAPVVDVHAAGADARLDALGVELQSARVGGRGGTGGGARRRRMGRGPDPRRAAGRLPAPLRLVRRARDRAVRALALVAVGGAVRFHALTLRQAVVPAQL